MEIDIEGVLEVVKQQAAQIAVQSGAIVKLQKVIELQKKQLEELKQENP